MDGATDGNLRFAACTSIFKGSKGDYIICFSSYIDIDNALKDEILGVMLAIELVVV